MKFQCAFIYVAPNCNPDEQRAVIPGQDIDMNVIGCSTYDQAEIAAKEMVEKGCTAIELCAGFGNEGIARIKRAVGDGIAAAQRAGAEVVNMELVQFHPTTMMPQKGQSERRFLISEAVRGEGGILRNHLGEAFMQGKHELADLAPRDIVTREIIHEMRRTGRDNVYLDVSSMSEEFFSRRFPTIFGECR